MNLNEKLKKLNMHSSKTLEEDLRRKVPNLEITKNPLKILINKLF